MEDRKNISSPNEADHVQDLGAASDLTQAIGNTGVEPNFEPLYFK
jgi:hypothetical protein